jgi:hypothetical protein
VLAEPNFSEGVFQMDVVLKYQGGREFTEYFRNFEAEVSRNAKGVRISFREKTEGRQGFLRFSVPFTKAKQLAHATLTICAEDGVEPVKFSIEEETTKGVGAA